MKKPFNYVQLAHLAVNFIINRINGYDNSVEYWYNHSVWVNLDLSNQISDIKDRFTLEEMYDIITRYSVISNFNTPFNHWYLLYSRKEKFKKIMSKI